MIAGMYLSYQIHDTEQWKWTIEYIFFSFIVNLSAVIWENIHPY